MVLKLGKRIKSVRENHNISQSELADRLQYLNQSQISKIEKGDRKTTAQDLIEIAQALGVTVNDIVSGEKAQKAN